MLPESLLMIGETKSEAEAAGSWGSMICLAFLVGFILQSVVSSFKLNQTVPSSQHMTVETSEEDPKTKDLMESDTTVVALGSHENQSTFDVFAWKPLAYIISIGDFLHNFVDGFFIAIAFQCSNTLGWEVNFVRITNIHLVVK
jgi:zinc transporter ZupT